MTQQKNDTFSSQDAFPEDRNRLIHHSNSASLTILASVNPIINHVNSQAEALGGHVNVREISSSSETQNPQIAYLDTIRRGMLKTIGGRSARAVRKLGNCAGKQVSLD